MPRNSNDPTKGKLKEFDFPPELLEECKNIAKELAEKYDKVNEEMLSRLFLSTVIELTSKIESGIATPAHISNAVRILVENNIQMELDGALDEMAEAIEDLPEHLKVVDFPK